MWIIRDLFTVYHRNRSQYEVNINFRLTGPAIAISFVYFYLISNTQKSFYYEMGNSHFHYWSDSICTLE